ncbi:MAG: hypothetical protein JWQ87_5230 [Candidatus Sulfotelmatobacter sp.]|nr:hypothetical protein [Candidatus Sulfotelmatobacter sp.]
MNGSMKSLEPDIFDSFELRGRWWLPERPDDRVHGTLSFSSNGIRLRLDETFTNPAVNHPFWAAGFRPECILGFTVEEECCTLYKSFCSRIGATQEFLGNALLRGEHFAHASDLLVTGALVEFTNLVEWVDLTLIAQEPGATPDHFRLLIPTSTKRLFTVRETSPFRELTLILGSQISLAAEGVSAERRSHFDLHFLHPLPFPEAEEIIGQLGILVSVLQGENAYANRIRFRIAGPEGRARSLELFRVPRGSKPAIRSAHDMTMSFTQLSGDAACVFGAWFLNANQLDPVYDLLASSLSPSRHSVRTRFLLLAQAIESFHRRVLGGTYVSVAAYQPVHQAIAAAIPGNLESAFRSRIKDSLRYAYQYSLRTRLKALLKTLTVATKAVIIPGKEADFVDLVVNVRNYLTHYDESTALSLVHDAIGMHNLNEQVRALLTILLLRQMGLSEEKAAGAVNQNFYLPNR